MTNKQEKKNDVPFTVANEDEKPLEKLPKEIMKELKAAKRSLANG